jgi:hypothetical protein
VEFEGIAAAVLKLLGDSSLVKSLSIKGRKMAEDHCWEKVSKILFGLYGIEQNG